MMDEWWQPMVCDGGRLSGARSRHYLGSYCWLVYAVKFVFGPSLQRQQAEMRTAMACQILPGAGLRMEPSVTSTSEMRTLTGECHLTRRPTSRRISLSLAPIAVDQVGGIYYAPYDPSFTWHYQSAISKQRECCLQELGYEPDNPVVRFVMGETGRLQDWKDCCYYYCYGKEREMERCGSSQGLDLWVAGWACTLWGGLTAWDTQQFVFTST